jgi:hypothetical protein
METEVQTEVVHEQELWAVYVVVFTDEGVDRRLVESHLTEAGALRAAEVIRRAAARRRPPREPGAD